MDRKQSGGYVCRFCQASFTQVMRLHKHLQQAHSPSSTMKNSRTCPICGLVFGIGGNNENYRTHLRHIHGQREEGKFLAFKSFNDFFLWKTEFERKTSCQYALQAAPKVLPTNEKIHVYQCDSTPPSNKKRKFNVSNISQPKCPAMICATESLKNLDVKVDYWNTHVGHSIQVEEDELNAAISSVQGDAHAEVMDMLNSIGQGIETGAEVYVSETDDHVMSSAYSRDIYNNMFNKKKEKSSKTIKPPNSPVVSNFSFKKDPSKKKESSIYSLASVACGKVSANKVNINKSASAQFQDLVKNIAKRNSGTITNSKPIASPNKKGTAKTNDTRNFEYPSSDIDSTCSKQVSSKQVSSKQTSSKQVSSKQTTAEASTIGGRFVAIQSMPAKSSTLESNIQTGSTIETENPPETSIGKSMPDKENVSLDCNKIDRTEDKSAPHSLLKSNSKNSGDIIKSTRTAKNRMVENLQETLGIITPGTQIVLASAPVQPQNVGSPSNVKKPLIQSSPYPFSAVTPVAQSFISIDNKLIPIVNTPGTVLNPTLGPGIILPSTLPQLPTNQMTAVSKSTPSFSGSIPGRVIMTNDPLPTTSSKLTSTLSSSSFTTSFPSAPVVLIPSVVPSTLQPNSSLHSTSPLVLHTAGSSTTLPVQSLLSTPSVQNAHGKLNLSSLNKSASFVENSSTSRGKRSTTSKSSSTPSDPNSLANIDLTPIKKLASEVENSVNISSPTVELNSEKSSSIKKNLPAITTNSVTVQKVSLPVTKSTTSSTPPLSENSSLKYVNLNSTSTTSAPNLNISNLIESKVHKPGTYVFESSGELYMLEPLDDDLVVKNSNPQKSVDLSSPNTSLPSKRKLSSVEDSAIKSKKKKKEIISSTPSAYCVYDDSTKSAHVINRCEDVFSDSFDGNSNSCASDTPSISENTTSLEDKSSAIESSFVKILPKPPPPVLTVKTVPSFSIPQSKPVPSFINSMRSPSSSLLPTSSAPLCISSVQSMDHSTSEQSTTQEEETKLKQMNEDVEKQSEVKRNVTIKSVVQEKRCLTDDDFEITKKVKFYKLEMKYYSCQEECKKLKIELAKVLSKNKELMGIIEDLKKDKNCVKIIEKKLGSEENISGSNEKTRTKSATIEDNSKDNETSDDSNINPSPKNDLIESDNDDYSLPDIDIVSDTNSSDNEITDKPDESKNGDQVKSTNISQTDDVNFHKAMTDEKNNGSKEVESVSEPVKASNVTDITLNESKNENKEIKHDSNVDVALNIAEIFTDKEMIDITDESSSGRKETEPVPNEVSDIAEASSDKEIIDRLDEHSIDNTVSEPDTAVIPNNMTSNNKDIELTSKQSNEDKAENTGDVNFQCTNFEENLSNVKEDKTVAFTSVDASNAKGSCETADSNVISEEGISSKVDVYTMVRTSVLRDLYLDIEDLCKEKKKLLEDMEHLKQLNESCAFNKRECE